MRVWLITAISAAVLAGCATSPETQPSSLIVDDQGFADRDSGAVYHVGTGLFCPERHEDLSLSHMTEYSKGVDASCRYEGQSSRVTVYAYLSGGSLKDELEGAVMAVLEASDDNNLTLSPVLSDQCEAVGASYNMQSQLLSGLSDLMKNGGNEINVDPSPESGPVPYLITAIQSDALNTYAAISQAGKWRIKARYTTFGDFSADDEAAQCEYLHRVVRTTVLSHGQPDGQVERGGFQSILDRIPEDSTDS